MISLLSDWGNSSPSLTALRVKLSQMLVQTKLIDIAHDITPFDLSGAAWLLQSILPEFKVPAVHIVFVDCEPAVHQRFIASKMGNQYILSADNGLVSLLSFPETVSHRIIYHYHEENYSFIEKDIFCDVAQKILMGIPFEELGEEISEVKDYRRLSLMIDEYRLTGQIMYIDNFGNLVTNINRADFEKAAKGRSFQLILRQHDRHDIINKTYSESAESEMSCIFNSSGFLEISLYRDNAHKLLGMAVGMAVMVEFK
jgi:S-adenosylmethionine hydrolase